MPSQYIRKSEFVPIVQWIEHSRPKGGMCVRFVLGTQCDVGGEKVLIYPRLLLLLTHRDGPVAHLVERGIRIAEVRGSIPLRSTE